MWRKWHIRTFCCIIHSPNYQRPCSLVTKIPRNTLFSSFSHQKNRAKPRKLRYEVCKDRSACRKNLVSQVTRFGTHRLFIENTYEVLPPSFDSISRWGSVTSFWHILGRIFRTAVAGKSGFSQNSSYEVSELQQRMFCLPAHFILICEKGF